MSFAGRTIGFRIASPTPTDPRTPLLTEVVDDGVEFPDIGALEVPGDGYFVVDAILDFGADTIAFTVTENIPGAFLPTGFNGYVFTDEDGTIPTIRGISIVEGSNSMNFEGNRVHFSDDRIFLKLDGQFYTDNSSVTLKVRFGENSALRTSDDALFVARLYTAGLGRAPDDEGMNFWIDALPAVGSRDALSAEFLDSVEFADRFGSVETLGARGYVEQLYENVLGREGETQGVNFWTGSILSGELTEAETLTFFVDSPENAANSPGFESFAQNAATGDWVFL